MPSRTTSLDCGARSPPPPDPGDANGARAGAPSLERKGTHLPPNTVTPESSLAHDVDLLDFARAHVARVRTRCPQFQQVDEAVWTGVVLAHLAPLPADRPWTRRQWAAARGEPTWTGGAVGMRLPALLRDAA